MPGDEQQEGDIDTQAYPQPGSEDTPSGAPEPMPKIQKYTTDEATVIVIPKGLTFDGEATTADVMKLQEDMAKLEDSKKSLEKQVADLTKKLANIDANARKELAKNVVTARIEKGLSKKEDEEADVEKLSKLSAEQLGILSEDVKKLTAADPPVGDPEPVSGETGGTPDERALSEKQKKMEKKRKEMFGHSKPLGEDGKPVDGDA